MGGRIDWFSLYLLGSFELFPCLCVSPVVYFDRAQQNKTSQSWPLTSDRPKTRPSYQLQAPGVKRLSFLICRMGLPGRAWLLEKL